MPVLPPPQWRTPTCHMAPLDHRAEAAYVAYFRRACGHLEPDATLLCIEHGARIRSGPEAGRATACPDCGEVSPLRLDRLTTFVVHRQLTLGIRELLATPEDRDRDLNRSYDRAIREVVQLTGQQPIVNAGPLARWEDLGDPFHGGPHWRCTFLVLTCRPADTGVGRPGELSAAT